MSSNSPEQAKEKELCHKLSLYSRMAEIYPSDTRYLRRIIELQLLLGEEQSAMEKMRRLEKIYNQQGNRDEADTLKKLRRNISTQCEHLESTFHPFLADLTPQALALLMQDSKRLRFKEGQPLMRQGERDSRIFIVVEGELAVLVQYAKAPSPTLIHTLGEGSIVGETAFLDGSSRNATVVANQDTVVLELNPKRVIKCLLQFPEVGEALRHESLHRRQLTAINSNRLLARLEGEAREALAARSVIVSYKPFEVIGMANTPLGQVGIVIEGLIRCVAEDKSGNSHILAPLKPGDTIGDLEALNGLSGMCDLVAVHPSQVLQIPAEDYLAVMESNPTIRTRILEDASRRISSTMIMLNNPA